MKMRDYKCCIAMAAGEKKKKSIILECLEVYALCAEVKLFPRSNPTIMPLPEPTAMQGWVIDSCCHLLHLRGLHKN